MSASEVTKQYAQSQRCVAAESKQKNKRKQDAVISAFDSIFEIYKDAQAISNALDSAKRKLSSLKAELSEAISHQTKIGDHYERLSNELWTLANLVDQTHANPDMSSFAFVTSIMGQVHDFAELAEGFGRTAEERAELRNEIEETTRFITMLQGAKVVADAGGISHIDANGVKSEGGQAQSRFRVQMMSS